MRKLIIIMVILAIILVGMIFYRKNSLQTKYVSMEEIQQIESYINQIYMGKEITGDALPYFEDINQAEDKWIWEVIKKNLEDDKLTYEQIEEKGKELFGEKFTKTFPKEGNEYLPYLEETNQYEAVEVESDQEGDLFLFNQIEKTKNGYEIEIIEYLEDNSPMLKEEAADYVIIKNLKEEEIGRVSASNPTEETEIVKRNEDQFTKKTLQIRQEDGKLYVEKVF